MFKGELSSHGCGAVKMLGLAIFTALVLVATIAIQLYIPATGGYFNLGESMIYVAAILGGPVVAAVAGGVGAALADVLSAYTVFAPGTLVIKAAEGFVVGYLYAKLRKYRNIAFPLSILLGIVVALSIALIGTTFLSGEAEASAFQIFTFTPSIPKFVWIIVALLVFIAIVFAGRARGGKGVETLSMLVGGLVMVLGYFLYEYFVSNPLLGREPIAAIAEVIPNLGQCLIGIAIAIPLVSFIERARGSTTSRESLS